eukprot:45886-Eustigmatos_ZCMA.PRE.1
MSTNDATRCSGRLSDGHHTREPCRGAPDKHIAAVPYPRGTRLPRTKVSHLLVGGCVECVRKYVHTHLHNGLLTSASWCYPPPLLKPHMLMSDRSKLSKRHGATFIDQLRQPPVTESRPVVPTCSRWEMQQRSP